MADLNLCSFNMHGFNNGVDFVMSMSQQFDIICLQEHWLRPGDTLPFNNFYDFNKFIFSGLHDDDVRTVGRPYGGLAILTKSAIVASDLGCCVSKRVQCVSLEYNDKIFVIFNVYFPCIGADNYELDVELICSFMVDIMNNVMTPGATVIVAGDFTIDLTMIDNVNNLSCLKRFVNDCGLQSCMSFYKGNLHHTYRCDARKAYSMLDNILIPNSVDQNVNVTSVDIVDDTINFSDHLLVKCILHINSSNNSKNKQGGFNRNKVNSHMAYVWSDEAKQQYYGSTGITLQYLISELSEQKEHFSRIEFVNKLYNGIVCILKDCSALHYKRFTVKRKTNFQWTHALNDLKIK